jgi:hypothetical protein
MFSDTGLKHEITYMLFLNSKGLEGPGVLIQRWVPNYKEVNKRKRNYNGTLQFYTEHPSRNCGNKM